MIYIKRIISVPICTLSICTFIIFCSSTATFAATVDDVMPIIDACVDIGNYDRDTTDINDLTLRVLHAHTGFESLIGTPPEVISADNLKMCDAEYIERILNDIFRITAPRPEPSRLTELNYCYSNGYYTYYGKPTDNFNSTVNEISNTVELDNGGLLIVFSDTHATDGNSVTRYNTAIFARDDDGFYLRSLTLDADLSDVSSVIDRNSATSEKVAEFIKRILPFAIAVIALALAVFVLFRYVLF